jgi:hypothetical protein
MAAVKPPAGRALRPALAASLGLAWSAISDTAPQHTRACPHGTQNPDLSGPIQVEEGVNKCWQPGI